MIKKIDDITEKKSFKVAHFSYGDDYGAFGAAYELHKSLVEMDIESTFFVRHKTRNDDSIVELGYCDSIEERLFRIIDKLYFDLNRKNEGTAPIHFDGLGINLDKELEEKLRGYDIFHIHWVAGFLDIDNIYQLSKLNKQIVWTMHDFHPFTGGCHCPEVCENYTKNCSDCHELKLNPENITKYLLLEKKSKYPSSIYIIVASDWLRKIVRNSNVFQKNVCELIPIGIDTKSFILKNKNDMKQKLGISINTKVILIGAQALEQNIKGYVNLEKILQIIEEDIYCKELLERKQLVLLTFGHADKENRYNGQIPIINMGFIQNREKLCDIYNAADVFIFPSLQDTFGMTAVEAMSCGVPTIAFNIGAMQEVIVSGVNGYKAEVNDFQAMASWVIQIIKNNPINRDACRKYIVDNYDLKCESYKMVQFYQKIIAKNNFNDMPEMIGWKNKEIDIFINRCAFEILTGITINKYKNMELKDMLLEYNPEFVSPEQKVKRLIEKNEINKENLIYIYGAGDLGKRTMHVLENYKMQIEGFWDLDKMKEGHYIECYTISQPVKKTEIGRRKIIVAGLDYRNMVECLIKLGYRYNQDFF